MSENGTGDLAGIGKIAEAIPEEGWKKAIDTACDTFTDLIAPITKTTAGLGGLIQAKFDAMVDVQKVFAADAVERARRKTQARSLPHNARPSARVLISAIEEASVESDESLRDIWSNLIANELTQGSIHPEFPKILSRLSPADAIVLSEIAEENANKSIRAVAVALSASFSVLGVSAEAFSSDDTDAHHEHLAGLNLIVRRHGKWILTRFGEEFVRAVTDPSLVANDS